MRRPRPTPRTDRRGLGPLAQEGRGPLGARAEDQGAVADAEEVDGVLRREARAADDLQAPGAAPVARQEPPAGDAPAAEEGQGQGDPRRPEPPAGAARGRAGRRGLPRVGRRYSPARASRARERDAPGPQRRAGESRGPRGVMAAISRNSIGGRHPAPWLSRDGMLPWSGHHVLGVVEGNLTAPAEAAEGLDQRRAGRVGGRERDGAEVSTWASSAAAEAGGSFVSRSRRRRGRDPDQGLQHLLRRAPGPGRRGGRCRPAGPGLRYRRGQTRMAS